MKRVVLVALALAACSGGSASPSSRDERIESAASPLESAVRDRCLTSLCGQAEGDCDADWECLEGLVCTQDAGPRFALASSVDICLRPECSNGLLDEGEVSVDCGGACGACSRPTELAPGTPDYCSSAFPCSLGEGDCDSDSECTTGLRCLAQAGPLFGLRAGYDACSAPWMTSGKEQIYNFLDEPEPPAPGRPNGIGMAKLLLENCWHLPRSPKVCFAPPLTFTEDPFGEKYWRILFYSLRPLANLSFAWGATEDPRYGDKLVELLTWFVEARSTANGSYLWDRHTAAFRAMMLVNLHRKLEAHGALTPTLERELPLAIAETAAFLALPSSFEAGNNHGYTEAAALLLVAELYPEHDQAAAWRTLAQERLLTVTQNTVGSDGVLIEQSTFYHFYSLALLFQITDWARRFGVALAPEVTSAVQKMIRFATLVPQPDGMVPRLDASNALDLGAFNVSVLDALAQQHPEFAFVRSQGRAGARPADADLAALFPESGKAVLRSSFGSTASFTAQAHVVFDAGPYRTAHSQLDALNVHLFGGGRELLTDSGLFSLESDLEEFDYYSGTAAHNTVVVDGADQKRGAAYAGPTVLEGDARWQSGWHTLYPGVLHTRGVLLLGRGSLTVIDRMNSGEQHRYAQMWHLSPDLEVALSNSGGVITDSRGAVVARFTTTSAGTTHLQRVRGRANPRQGWYATMYETEVPGTVVEIEEEGSSSSLRITSFSFGPDARHTPELEVAEREDELSATLTLGTKRRVLTVQSFGTTREVFSLLEE